MPSPLAAIDESFTLRRLRRRLGFGPPGARHEPTPRPVGAKLELTHRCNLRCGFCYTDSPRRTLERALDMSDDDWRRVVDEAIELGVIEAVVTGGEPLLRRELSLELIERLHASGVSVTLNTNGWFVDESLADELASLPGVRVHISIDGATPELHDAARGVPGSWRRAVRAVHLLLERGVAVHIVHVVTPDNERTVSAFLDQMLLLGVGSVRLTPVVRIGAAADSEDWGVSRRRLRRAVSEFHARHGNDLVLHVRAGTGAGIAVREEHAPAALLVRPLGAVLIDSLHPFAFGNVRELSLEECWRGIVESWRAPEISRWARRIRTAGGLGRAELVPYRDEELPVGSAAPADAGTTSGARGNGGRPEPKRGPSLELPGDLAAARDHVLRLALARRYRLAPLRWTGDPDGDRYVHVVSSRRVLLLNRSAGVVMDSLERGSPAEAVERLAELYPATERQRIELDVLAGIRRLVASGIVESSTGRADAVETVSELP